MFSYALILCFKGTDFCGWQKQSQGEITVQGELEKILKKITNSEEVRSVSSGRTDTGVHALRMLVHIEISKSFSNTQLLHSLNSLLPKSILVKSVDNLDKFVSPLGTVSSRKYIYLFSNHQYHHPFDHDFIVNISYDLDIKKMQQAALILVGEHDFINYMCVGTPVDSTRREVFACYLSKEDETFHGLIRSHYKFEIQATGFLKQMIRLIMGTLIQIGRGKVSLDEFEESLKAPVPEKLGPTAPGHGLFKIS